MSYEVYYLMHFAGLALLVGTLGGLAFAKRSEGGKPPKALTILHGVATVVMLFAGFGLLARRGITGFPWPTWVFVKFGVWIVLGALPFLMRKQGGLRGVGGLLLTTGCVLLVSWALISRWA